MQAPSVDELTKLLASTIQTFAFEIMRRIATHDLHVSKNAKSCTYHIATLVVFLRKTQAPISPVLVAVVFRYTYLWAVRGGGLTWIWIGYWLLANQFLGWTIRVRPSTNTTRLCGDCSGVLRYQIHDWVLDGRVPTFCDRGTERQAPSFQSCVPR